MQQGIEAVENNELMLREIIENDNGGSPGILPDQILAPGGSLVVDNPGQISNTNDATFQQTLPMGDPFLNQQMSHGVPPTASESQQQLVTARVEVSNLQLAETAVNKYLASCHTDPQEQDVLPPEVNEDLELMRGGSSQQEEAPKQEELPPLEHEDKDLMGVIPSQQEDLPPLEHEDKELYREIPMQQEEALKEEDVPPPVVKTAKIANKSPVDEVKQDQSDEIMDKTNCIASKDDDIGNTCDDGETGPEEIVTKQEKTPKELDACPPVTQDEDAGATHQFQIPRDKLGFVIQGKKHAIVKVYSHSPVHGLVFEGKDELVSIDGKDIRKLTLDEVKEVTGECISTKSQFPHMIIGIKRTPTPSEFQEPVSVTPDKGKSDADAQAWVDSIFANNIAGSITKDDQSIDSPSGGRGHRSQPSEAMTTVLKDVTKEKTILKEGREERNVVYKRRWMVFCNFVDDSTVAKIRKTIDGRYLTKENVDEFLRSESMKGVTDSVLQQFKESLQWYAKHVENNEKFVVNLPTVDRMAAKSPPGVDDDLSQHRKRKTVSKNNANSNKKRKLTREIKQKSSIGKETLKKISLPLNARLVWEGAPPEDLQGGWPPGWTKRIYQRIKCADRHRDKYWYTPDDTRRFNSMKKVKEFLEGIRKADKNKATTKKNAIKKVLQPGSAYQLCLKKFCSFVDVNPHSRVKKRRDGRYLTRDNVDKFFEIGIEEKIRGSSAKAYRNALQWYANNVEFPPSSNETFVVNAPIVEDVRTGGKSSNLLETVNGNNRSTQRRKTGMDQSKRVRQSAATKVTRPKSYLRMWDAFCEFVDKSPNSRIKKTADGRYLTRNNIDEYFTLIGEEGVKGPKTLKLIKRGLQWHATHIEFQPSRGSEFMVESPTVQKYLYPKDKNGYVLSESTRRKNHFASSFYEISEKNIALTTRRASTRNHSRLALREPSSDKRKAQPKATLGHSSKTNRKAPRNVQEQSKCDRLREENERMKEEKTIEELRAENEDLLNNNERLRREREKLRERHAKLLEELIGTLRQENMRLKNHKVIEELYLENERLRGERLVEGLSVENKRLRGTRETP